MTRRTDDDSGPFRRMRRMHDVLDELFEDMFSTTALSTEVPEPAFRESFRQPMTDVWENEKQVFVTIELPGISKDDIQLDIQGKKMVVKVEKKGEISAGKKGLVSRSRSYKGYYTQLELPSDVVADRADATYNNGVLEIRIPKTTKEEGKKIKVK